MSFLKLPFFVITFSLILSGCGTTPSSSVSLKTSEDQDNDGYSVSQGDCQDEDPTVFPSAPELQDEKDNDCDGEIDENTEEQNGGSGSGNGEGNSTDDGDTPTDPDEPKKNDDQNHRKMIMILRMILILTMIP